MTDDQINQTISRAMGLHWHIWKIPPIPSESIDAHISCSHRICLTCGIIQSSCLGDILENNPDYTTDWSAWGVALEWALKQEWWEEFAYDWQSIDPFNEDLLSPKRGASVLTGFIDKNPEYFTKEVKEWVIHVSIAVMK